MNLFKYIKAVKRAKRIKAIREERLKREQHEAAEKAEIRTKLMERYDLPEEVGSVFLSYRGEEDCYSYVDEDGEEVPLETGNIIPYRRRGDLVFFYEITNTWRKYGDYGMSDYGYFMALKYHHYETIPQAAADSNKSMKIEWRKIDNDNQHGYIQGIRVVRIKLGENSHRGTRARRVKLDMSMTTLIREAKEICLIIMTTIMVSLRLNKKFKRKSTN